MLKLPHKNVGIRSSLYQPLDEDDVRRIADSAFEVLAKSGVAVYSAGARDALVGAGAEIDSDTNVVRLPRSMVEDAIDTNPSSITLYGRDGASSCILEENRVHYGTGGTAIYVLDPDTGEHRPSTIDDVILNARMVDRLEYVHLHTINVFPHDVENKHDIDINRFFHSLDNTKKHVMGGVYSLEGCRQVVEMSELIAGGEESLREEPFVSFITLIISPFKIDGHYGDITCYLARKGLPVVVPTEPICGTTSPITLAGNVLMHVAETLAGIVLVQSVKKGAPGICGSVGSITNLRTMDHVGGAIERAMINAAVAQLAQHFCLPLYSTAGTTDSKQVDTQAAYESAMSSLLVAMSGANYIHDIAGLMESDLTVSYEKLAMDNEILGMCQRVLRGVEVNDETLALDLMIDKGPGSDYLAEEHTVRHMRREFFQPELANRQKRGSMGPQEDAMSRAKRLVDEIRTEDHASCLSQTMRASIVDRFPAIHAARSENGQEARNS